MEPIAGPVDIVEGKKESFALVFAGQKEMGPAEELRMILRRP